MFGNLTGALSRAHLLGTVKSQTIGPAPLTRSILIDTNDDTTIFTQKYGRTSPGGLPACAMEAPVGAGRTWNFVDAADDNQRKKEAGRKMFVAHNGRVRFTPPASEDLVPITRHPPGATFSFHTLMRTGLSQKG